MTKIVRLVLALVALLATTTGTSTAHADDPTIISDISVDGGSGAYAPGLPSTGCAYQTIVTFVTLAGARVGDEGVDVHSLALYGSSSICETMQSGQGTLTASGGWSGTLNYSRTGTLMVLSGTLTSTGEPHTDVVLMGLLLWTSVNPVTSFVMVEPGAYTS